MGMDKFSDEVRKGVDEVRHVGTQLAEIIEQVQNLLPSFAAVHEGMQNQALSEIGRAHVWTPVTFLYLVCRLLLEKKKNKK